MSTVRRLTTIRRRSIHEPESDDQNATHPLYLCTLNAVLIPVLDRETITRPFDPTKAFVPAQETSVVKNDNIYLCNLTLQSFRTKVLDRYRYLKGISNSESQQFAFVLERYFQFDNSSMENNAFKRMVPMIDIISLVEYIAFNLMNSIKESKTGFATPVQMDEKLNSVIEPYIGFLMASILEEPDLSYEVRNHWLLRTGGLESLVTKYHLSASESNLAFHNDVLESVRNVFDVLPKTHEQTISDIYSKYNEGSVLAELRSYLDQLTQGHFPGYLPTDFEEDGFSAYQTQETARINEIMRIFSLRYPRALELSNTAIKGMNIPPNPQTAEKYFRVLVKLLLEKELNETGAKLQISKIPKAILNECGLRWALSLDFQEAAIFEHQIRRCVSGSTSITELVPFFNSVQHISVGKFGILRKCERDMLLNGYVNLHRTINNQLGNVLQLTLSNDYSPKVCNQLLENYTYFMKQMFSDPLCRTISEFPQYSNDELEEILAQFIRASAVDRANQTIAYVEKTFLHPDQTPLRITEVIQTYLSDLKKYQVYFESPLLQFQYVHSIAADVYINIATYYVEKIRTLDPDTEMVDVLELYDIVRDFFDYCEEIGVMYQNDKDIEALFLPSINVWIARTDAKWLEWVKRAYTSDLANGFECQDPPFCLNSVSVSKLFQSFQSGLSFLNKFRFNNPENQQFLKCNFIKAMHTTLNCYCQMNFDEFESFGTHALDTNIKIPRQLIIKLNNILAVRKAFDELLNHLNDGETDFKLVSAESPRKESGSTPTFEIKIIGARNLQDQIFQAPNGFTVLTIQEDIVGATPTIFHCRNPNWNCYYNFTLPESCISNARAFLQLNVFHENPLGIDIPNGSGSIFLNDEELDSYLSQNIKIALRPQGVLSVRIRKKGEIDDINWFMRRTQETIRFTIEDMIETFCSKITLTLEAKVKDIIQKTEGVQLFGISLSGTEQVTDESVETQSLSLLKFMDSILGQFNSFLDRRFDSYLKSIYTDIGSVLDVETIQDGSIIVQPTLSRGWTYSRYNKLKDKKTMSVPILIHLFWHKILQHIHTTLTGFKKVPDDKNLRSAKVLQGITELLKSLFHCKIGLKVRGLSIDQLETPLYKVVRTLFSTEYK